MTICWSNSPEKAVLGLQKKKNQEADQLTSSPTLRRLSVRVECARRPARCAGRRWCGRNAGSATPVCSRTRCRPPGRSPRAPPSCAAPASVASAWSCPGPIPWTGRRAAASSAQPRPVKRRHPTLRLHSVKNNRAQESLVKPRKKR